MLPGTFPSLSSADAIGDWTGAWSSTAGDWKFWIQDRNWSFDSFLDIWITGGT